MHRIPPQRARVIESAHHEETAHPPHPPTDPQLQRQAALFKLYRDNAQRSNASATPDPAQPPETGEAPVPENFAALADVLEQDEPSQDDSNEESAQEQGSDDTGAEAAPERGDAGETAAPASSSPAPTGIPGVAVHRAQAVHAAHAGSAAVQTVLKPAAAPLAQLVDFIVSSVADFYSSPAMLDSGNWSLTLSIDSAALPGCTLSLALSYFDLTLRFDTTNDSSRQLILEHTDLLRTRLEELFKTQPAAPRGIEIIVM
jgi:hypothetical protein